MAMEIAATYENGMLRPDTPLPLQEHQRVMVTVHDAAQSRGAASFEPMTLSHEDAQAMDEARRKGLARPKIAIAPLPPYDG
jgi:predicted DNA-binding antitoxin AbrB/MazE fold protein